MLYTVVQIQFVKLHDARSFLFGKVHLDDGATSFGDFWRLTSVKEVLRTESYPHWSLRKESVNKDRDVFGTWLMHLEHSSKKKGLLSLKCNMIWAFVRKQPDPPGQPITIKWGAGTAKMDQHGITSDVEDE